MEQELIEIEILYFDKKYFDQYFDDWQQGLKIISPSDQNWDYFFKPKKETHKILEILEYENGSKFLVLENDIIWYEAVPNFIDGKFSWITEDTRLISLRSLREKATIYNILFNNNITLVSFSELYKILDRNDKLKKLNI